MKVLVMGSPLFGVSSLQTLLKEPDIDVIGLVTQPMKPTGRGQQLRCTPMHQTALTMGCPVYTPTKKGIDPLLDRLQPDIVFVIAYGRLLSAHAVTHTLCVNAHASLLPAYRGASPIHASLLNGDTQTGITYIRMTEGLDEGPILAQWPVPIMPTDGWLGLHHRLMQTVSDTVVGVLKAVHQGAYLGTPQGGPASYCHKLQPTDRELIPGMMSPQELFNRVRAFSPEPGAVVHHHGKVVKIISGQLVNGHFEPILVRPEGKKTMLYHDYLQGHAPLF